MAIAVLFKLLRSYIQRLMDGRFFRGKYDAAKTLKAFGSRLRYETDVDKLSEVLVSIVKETMQPAHVNL